jgi:EmrB/QacA subfamily drug resistance transporter
MTASPTTSAVTDPLMPWPVFWIASIAVALVSLDGTMLFSVFGTLRSSFPSTTAAEMSWSLNGYTIVYAAMLIPAGGFADSHGRKPIFLLGLATFTAASAFCGLSGTVTLLVLSRAIQAVGAALLTPASLSILLASFPQSKRTLVVSSWGAVGGFAAAIGPSLGSYITETFGWSWAFFINVPLGICCVWLGARLLAPTPKAAFRRKIDLIGMSILIGAVSTFALAIVESQSPAWTRIDLFALTLSSIACWISFIVWARSARDPLISLDLFRNRTYTAVTAATFIFGIAFSIVFFAFFFYMTQIWHYDQARAGLAIAPGPLTVVPVAIISGRFAAKYGYRPFLVGGALLYALSGLWFLLVPGVQPAYATHWLPALFLSGAGVGLVLPSLSGAAVSRLPADQYAVGSAVNQASRQIGGVIGVAIAVLLLGHSTVHRVDFDAVYKLQIALAVFTSALCTLVRR